MNQNFNFDVFLSHNAKDKPQTRQLAVRLKQAGLRVWFDEWNVTAGDVIALKVDEGLEQSRVLILCISPNALSSGWVALERSTAIHRDPANEGRRFIPVLLADCDLPETLRRYKYVDLRSAFEAGVSELIVNCRAPIQNVDEYFAPVVSKQADVKILKNGSNNRPINAPLSRKKGVKSNDSSKRLVKRKKPIAMFEKKISAHKSWVNCLAVSSDSEWVVSGAGNTVSNDKLIKIWNLRTGECQTTISGHAEFINDVAITPDGDKIISASDGVRMWRATDGGFIRSFTDIFSLSSKVLADGWRIFTASVDDCIALWDLHTGQRLKSIKIDELTVGTVTPDGHISVVGREDGIIEYWDLNKSICLATLKGHTDKVNDIQITSDGIYAVSGSDDRTVRIWDLRAASCIGILEGHQDAIDSIAIAPDGNLIATTGFTDSTVRLWNWSSGACLQTIRNAGVESTVSVAFACEGSKLIVGTTEGSLYIYKIKSIYMASISESTRRYVNAKVVLLGEGTAGKTSLAHRLIEDRYVVKDRTHGMSVWRLDLPLPHETGLEREALLWDLAGQEDYRLIHQLFLEETALALLLVNPQRDDPFTEAGDWLKALQIAVGARYPNRVASKLAIFSQIDVGGIKLSNSKIEYFLKEHDFAGWLPTSAKTGENCSDRENGGLPSKLKMLIAESIEWEKLPWTSTPVLLVGLKNAVVAMRDEQDIRLLRFAELTQRLEQALPDEKFSESDVRTAVTLLANHGLARPLKFGDLVLLQPELLNGYAGAIIRAARTHADEIGCVLEANIYKPNFDFTGVERLRHRPDEELLLRSLVQTFLDQSLCIAEETPHGRHLVFPSQYRREKDIPRDPEITVSYTFSGEWQTVWTTLVVRLWYSQEFKHRELWRNAAEFASSKGNILGLKVYRRRGEGAATISLYFDKEVSDELKVIFIEYVHRHLAKYGSEVRRDRRYVCQKCNNSVKDLDAVRKRIDAKKDFITCQICDDHVLLIDYIEQHLKSDEVARKILAMDAATTRELDTQALEQILIGHMMAIAGEANQIFRPLTMFDHGIDGEVEFKDDDGKASGKRIYIQLKSGNSYLRTRKSDGSEVFDVSNERHLEYWVNQPADVYLVIRQTDELTGGHVIRWMNITHYLRHRKNKESRQIIFSGEKLDMEAIWKVRDGFFPLVR